MKSKRRISTIIAVIGVLVLCAFIVVPTVRLSGGEHDVNVSYQNAQVEKDKLLITVNYGSDGEFFEIGRDIIVATDKDFTETLQIQNCKANDGKYEYEFSVDNLSDLNRVYIKPPVLYMPTEISPVSVPLIEGAKANKDIESKYSDWFSISKVEVAALSEQTFLVTVIVEALALDLPRFPKLTIGDTQIGGISALSFDENTNFSSGEFQFSLNAESEKRAIELLDNASLVLSDALIKVEAEEMIFSSSIKTISVIVVDEE